MANTSVKYQPKLGRVLIERERSERIGSIIIPNAEKHSKCTGIIVALGETAGWTDSYNESGESIAIQTLKVGDEVIFGRFAGTWLDATYRPDGKDNDDGKLFICQDADILCVVTKEQENERSSIRKSA